MNFLNAGEVLGKLVPPRSQGKLLPVGLTM